MNSNNPFHGYNNNLASLFEEHEKFTFFVGAGISIDPPAGLLPAKLFSRFLLELCTPLKEIDTLLAQTSLRYEMMVEIIQRYIDVDFEFMDYFDLFQEPNLIHFFLGFNIINGNIVFTTNFDNLIEFALKKILPEKNHYQIQPIITSKEFGWTSNPEELLKANMLGIFKLHGSKRNIITKIKNKETLINNYH